MEYRIRNPQWITVETKDGPFAGYDQTWYGQERQRRAGCGPTTASVIASYLDMKEKEIPTPACTDALQRMDEMWKYVTPRLGGLYRTDWFRDGIMEYFRAKHLEGKAEMFTVHPLSFLRPDPKKAAEFISGGIREDCPVAFLNRGKGEECFLYTWHWVPLTAIETSGDDDWTCSVWDEGKEGTFSLRQWIRHSGLGGGFVRIMETESAIEEIEEIDM